MNDSAGILYNIPGLPFVSSQIVWLKVPYQLLATGNNSKTTIGQLVDY